MFICVSVTQNPHNTIVDHPNSIKDATLAFS